MSGHFDTMQVCLKGHQITARYTKSPQFRQERCEKCGAKTINACQNCNAPIRGYYERPNVISLCGTETPLYCHVCGKAYPWATRLKIRENLKIPAWIKKAIKWAGHNLVTIIISIAITVISAVIIWNLGIK